MTDESGSAHVGNATAEARERKAYLRGLERAAEWHETWAQGAIPHDGSQESMAKLHRKWAEFFRRDAHE